MPRRTTASPEPPADETPGGDTSGSAATTATAVEPDEPQTTAGPGAASAPPAAESGFFAWLRGIGVPRRPGWLGGVCAGVAERIGIDPLIVRGIVVVLAVVGAPVALLYAVAWFLLPDEHGIIHAQELGHGRVTRALPGIIAVFLVSFLPLTQGLWYTGALYWSNLDWGGGIARAVWTGVLLVVVVVVVVWLARRASADVPTTPATTDDRPDTVPTFPAGSDAEAEAEVAASVAAALAGPTASAPVAAPGEPPAPPADASAEELADWKRSQDEWQQQRAAWAAEQKRSERERRQAAASAQALAAMEASRERARIRKLTRPRASAGVVFLVFGLALVAAALSALFASNAPATRGAEWMIGAAVMVLVLGVGTVIVGLARRRSGALAFFSILSVLALVAALAVPTDRQLLPPGYWVSGSADGRYAQLFGQSGMYVSDRDGDTAIVDLWQLGGSVNVNLEEGATFRLEFEGEPRSAWVSVDQSTDDGGRFFNYQVNSGDWDLTVGEGDPDLVLRLSGFAPSGSSISVYITAHTADGSFAFVDRVPDEVHAWDSQGNVIEPSPIPTETTTPGAP